MRGARVFLEWRRGYLAYVNQLFADFALRLADEDEGPLDLPRPTLFVQLVAQLCGAGFGMVLRSSAAAIVADVLVPLGLWIVTGAVASFHGLQAWLTPFAAVGVLLSGQIDPQRWAQVGVVVLVWVVALNLVGALRLNRLTKASAMSAHVG